VQKPYPLILADQFKLGMTVRFQSTPLLPTCTLLNQSHACKTASTRMRYGSVKRVNGWLQNIWSDATQYSTETTADKLR
jgi:hypothetical protein